MQRTTQIGLIHFSDIHFSSDNTKEWEELSSLVLQDLRAAESWFPSDIKIDDLALALSGDFTQRAKTAEFDQAAAFIKSLLDQEIPIKKSKSSHDDDNDHVLTLADVYLVPGNHDVVFTEKEKKARFGPFSTFYNELFDNVENRKLVTAHDPKSFTCVHERDNLILAEVNCCEYVEKDTPEQSRGNIDNESIKKLDTELEALKEANLDKFERSAKVLMLHHHPVLLPSFVEDRGNDSVANGNWLMWIARRYGFQLVLHGHKHIPCTFTYDPSIAFEPEGKPAVLFVAGGSVNGSLPESITSNTYNLILLKWHPEAKQGRVRVITRGLIKKENGRNGTDPMLLPKNQTGSLIS
jgi:predicted MPP superfamily phosphohydrolase